MVKWILMVIHYISAKMDCFPVKLNDVADNSPDTRMAKRAYDEICSILKLKKIPDVYIIGKRPSVYSYPKGYHFYGKIFPHIFIVDEGQYMMFYLAHELFHEFQQEHSHKEFINPTPEIKSKHEVEADAFALAYCECFVTRSGRNDTDRFVPNKVTHDYYLEEVKNAVGKDGVPVAVRNKAEEYKNEFNFEAGY